MVFTVFLNLAELPADVYRFAVGVERETIVGAPDLKTSTVCHMERFFLSMRQGNKRTACKTLAYSKDWNNHALMFSIFISFTTWCAAMSPPRKRQQWPLA